VSTSAAATSDVANSNHPVGFWFFFWGEFAERCSYYGMRAILSLYMIERLGIDKSDAGTYMSLFIAACYFFPLIGGWVADNFLGKYWTIVLFSLPYVIAQCIVGIENKTLVIGSLCLLAMGSGVIKPNISTLMGLTYDQQRPGQKQLRTEAFSWFYMAINIGAFIAQFGMPVIRDRFGYQTAFIFPAVLMALALFIFALGKRFYAQESIVRKVVGDSSRAPEESRTVTGIPVKTMYVSPEVKAEDSRLKMETLGKIGALFVTVMFFWAIFDQSASTWIFFADTYMNCTLAGMPVRADAIQAFNPLFIVLLVPVSVWFFKKFPLKATTKIALGFVLTGLSMVIMALAGFLAGEASKALKVNLPEGSVVIPSTSQKLDEVAGELKAGEFSISSSEFKFNPANKKVEFKNGEVTLPGGAKLAIVDGHAAALASTKGFLETVPAADPAKISKDSATVTVESIDWVKPEEKVSVWWQIFAYLILTIAEILISITGLELAFVAAPESMKSFVTACWLCVVFLANLLINAPVTRLYTQMSPEIYFAMLAGAMAAVLLIYMPIAKRFDQMMARNESAA
jgi:POT family proton-dependent oligopeptide transporter